MIISPIYEYILKTKFVSGSIERIKIEYIGKIMSIEAKK